MLQVGAAIVAIAPAGERSAIGELVTKHEVVKNLVLARFFKQDNKFGGLPAQGSKWRCRGCVSQRPKDGDRFCDPALFCKQTRQVQAREMVASIGKVAQYTLFARLGEAPRALFARGFIVPALQFIVCRVLRSKAA